MQTEWGDLYYKLWCFANVGAQLFQFVAATLTIHFQPGKLNINFKALILKVSFVRYQITLRTATSTVALKILAATLHLQ